MPTGMAPIAPAPTKGSVEEPPGVEWRKLAGGSVRFLALMHVFRWATEPGTRSGGVSLGGPFLRSVGNLHGWSDGDPFYVNYVGHPLQGAIAGRLFLLNDRRFNLTEFGRSSEYWKGKLRGAAFSWAFSQQFEIGPLSEASIGRIQSQFPQQGFVDHVVTPVVGFAWTIGEDAIDRFVIKAVENRTDNRWARLLVRSALNPSRTVANVMDGKVPWYRASRAGVLVYSPSPREPRTASRSPYQHGAPRDDPKPAPFEFTAAPTWRHFGGAGDCVGGGAEGAWRVGPELQLVLAVNGCKLVGQPQDRSGDALVYQVGPRWTPSSTKKWSPYAHLLVGGMKVTNEQLFPEQKAAVLAANKGLDPMLSYTLHEQYTRREEANGVAITAGTGVDYKLTDALALRVASVEYQRSTIPAVGGVPYNNGLQVTTGMVLRLGTW
jgi:hypothetical protein